MRFEMCWLCYIVEEMLTTFNSHIMFAQGVNVCHGNSFILCYLYTSILLTVKIRMLCAGVKLRSKRTSVKCISFFFGPSDFWIQPPLQSTIFSLLVKIPLAVALVLLVKLLHVSYSSIRKIKSSQRFILFVDVFFPSNIPKKIRSHENCLVFCNQKQVSLIQITIESNYTEQQFERVLCRGAHYVLSLFKLIHLSLQSFVVFVHHTRVRVQ